jgi:hypothetical protein
LKRRGGRGFIRGTSSLFDALLDREASPLFDSLFPPSHKKVGSFREGLHHLNSLPSNLLMGKPTQIGVLRRGLPSKILLSLNWVFKRALALF